MKMIRVKVHRRGSGILIAACDEGLLGRLLKDDKLRLDVSDEFYGGDQGGEKMLVSRLAMATMANLVGEVVCRIAAEHDFIDPDCLITIEGVPHAQMVRY